jgi:hypothetical protein
MLWRISADLQGKRIGPWPSLDTPSRRPTFRPPAFFAAQKGCRNCGNFRNAFFAGNGGEGVLLHLSITCCLSMLFYKTACLVPQDVPQIGPLGNRWPLRRPRTSGGRRRRTRLKTRWRRRIVDPKPVILTEKNWRCSRSPATTPRGATLASRMSRGTAPTPGARFAGDGLKKFEDCAVCTGR